MSTTIRSATPSDAAALLAIYTPIVEQTPVSFELVPPTENEFAAKITAIIESHAWLVMENKSKLLGYAYGSTHRAREAYRFAVETSVYVHPDHYGEGIGRALYLALFQDLRKKQFHNAYAGITLPNDGSVALHKAVGFEAIGTFREIGYKFGRWHDVSWWQRALQS